MNFATFVNRLLSRAGFRIVHSINYDFLNLSPHLRAGKRWSVEGINPELVNYIKSNILYSNSQIEQDLFASWTIDKAIANGYIPQRKNFFVEFGATNGYKLSNTFFLEKYKNWTGLLAEPAHVWKQELGLIRKCNLDFRCVYSSSGKSLQFTEADDPELGTLSGFVEADDHAWARENGVQYTVETVSLNDLLLFHNAPNFIDYLSVDTEGSEFEILAAFDFSKHEFGVITVEHNFTPKRQDLYELLTKQNYVRVLTEVSGQDDWYVNRKLAAIFN